MKKKFTISLLLVLNFILFFSITILLFQLILLWKGSKAPINEPVVPVAPLTIEKIFSLDKSLRERLPMNRKITLLATGDVIVARTVNAQTVEKQNFLWPYEKTAGILRNADITVVNLETPLIGNCIPSHSGLIFCGDIRNVEGLIFAGVDVVNLGNNHAGNYGQSGLFETVGILEKNNIEVSGTIQKNIAYVTIKGVRFAFLGYDDIEPHGGVAKAQSLVIERQVKEADKKADIVVVQFSWGIEYTSSPTERQKELAYLAIDNGADLVLGNHPHWVQPVEFYKNTLITYAHGNFIFDQMWSQKTREGVIGKYTFFDKKLVDAEFIPIIIQDFGQPDLITDEAYKQQILSEMKLESTNLLLSQ